MSVKQIEAVIKKFKLGQDQPLTLRLFYILCPVGAICSFLAFAAALWSKLPAISTVSSFFCFLYMLAVTIYAFFSSHIQASRILICLGLNGLLFPILFFTSGGIDSGMVFYFLLGITVICMELNGWLRILLVAVALVEYAAVILVSLFFPKTVVPLAEEARYADILSNFIIVAVFIAIVFSLIISEYSRAHEKVMELNRKLMQQSITDELTGLYNRRYIMERLGRLMEEGRVFSVVLYDIDDFKKINDTYGHLVGDAALVHLAQRFTELTAGRGIPSRFGGEEFLIVFPDLAWKDAFAFAGVIQCAVAADTRFPAPIQRLTISGGVAQQHYATLQDLIAHVDHWLYQAKRNGKNQVCGSPEP